MVQGVGKKRPERVEVVDEVHGVAVLGWLLGIWQKSQSHLLRKGTLKRQKRK